MGSQWSPRAHNMQGQPWIPRRSQQRGTHGWPCIAGGTDKNAAHREIRANLMTTAVVIIPVFVGEKFKLLCVLTKRLKIRPNGHQKWNLGPK
ncbi:hypothetical protein GCM10010129_84320 [Streptomyces fumigatiscleroticus]|nr:hypothetical protein GCM10010129_84320 [Streptomyces fumigatiscleroticus]